MAARAMEWNAVEQSEPYPGIVRQTIVTETATVTRYTYHPGCVFPTHQHPDEQITVVHSGEIEFEVAGQRLTLSAGQLAVIPGNVPHGARVTAAEVVVTDNYFASANRAPIAVGEN